MSKSGRKAKSKIGTIVAQNHFSAARRADDRQKLLDEFVEWKETIHPRIRADIKKGLDPKQLREKYSPLAEARKLMIALTSTNESSALAAIKDIQDRTEGKAKERIDMTHRLAQMPDDELDALILSELQGNKEKN